MNKKTLTLTISILLIFLILSGFYLLPLLKEKKEQALFKKIKENIEIYTSKVIEEFSNNPNAKASAASREIAQELNETIKNPYNAKKPAFTFEKGCKSCCAIEYDDSISMIIVSSFDKTGEMQARVVIKPPSFVKYYKSEN